VFLYREVLHQELEGTIRPVRAKQPERLPLVLARAEVLSLISQLSGEQRLMAQLLRVSGQRLTINGVSELRTLAGQGFGLCPASNPRAGRQGYERPCDD
jgi:hypothetical protein